MLPGFPQRFPSAQCCVQQHHSIPPAPALPSQSSDESTGAATSQGNNSAARKKAAKHKADSMRLDKPAFVYSKQIFAIVKESSSNLQYDNYCFTCNILTKSSSHVQYLKLRMRKNYIYIYMHTSIYRYFNSLLKKRALYSLISVFGLKLMQSSKLPLSL